MPTKEDYFRYFLYHRYTDDIYSKIQSYYTYVLDLRRMYEHEDPTHTLDFILGRTRGFYIKTWSIIYKEARVLDHATEEHIQQCWPQAAFVACGNCGYKRR